MPIFRLQCEIGADSTLPRDAITITPHFNDEGVGSDPQGLCDDLSAALATYFLPTRQIEVTAYDAQGTVPVYPVGQTVVNPAVAPASTAPREVAVCLSYYSERNIPRRRGRLYIPFLALGFTAPNSVRPTGPVRDKVGELAQILADLGGVDVDWCLYSRVDDAAYPVTNWWVDDEWDTVRSRGLRSTTRTEGTVGEA